MFLGEYAKGSTWSTPSGWTARRGCSSGSATSSSTGSSRSCRRSISRWMPGTSGSCRGGSWSCSAVRRSTTATSGACAAGWVFGRLVWSWSARPARPAPASTVRPSCSSSRSTGSSPSPSSPLRAAALLGAFAVVASSLFGLYSLYVKLFLDQSPRGFTALVLVVIFLSGLQLVFLGVIGEYLGPGVRGSEGKAPLHRGPGHRPPASGLSDSPCAVSTPRGTPSSTGGTGGGGRGRSTWSSILRRYLPSERSSRILDVGCGAGLFFDRLSEFGSVQGVETDSTMRTGRPEIDDRIHWGTLESFPGDRAFDAVLMLDVLEHLADPLPPLRRALRAGGGSRRARRHRAGVPVALDQSRRPERALRAIHQAHVRRAPEAGRLAGGDCSGTSSTGPSRPSSRFGWSSRCGPLAMALRSCRESRRSRSTVRSIC